MALSRRAWLLVLAAFAIGLLLFLLIWMKQRNDHDFFRADSTTESVSGARFEPLPGPDMTAGGDRSGLSSAREDDNDTDPNTAQVLESRPQAPATGQPVAALPTPALPAPVTASGPDAPPMPISRPAPAYPGSALRRGESGEVLVRVQVGVDGKPDHVEVVRGSGSRALDRAATQGVKKWRFEPARRGGQAVEGTVQVPIVFSAR